MKGRIMKIAVISETSTADKNCHIISALNDRDHEIINLGMKEKGSAPELEDYIQAGILAGLVLNLKRADYVVGGCSTGQGFLNVALQFPNVICGQIRSPLNAWLFSQINGGNCISLTLNQDYGWGGDVNLGFIFDRLFGVEWGAGYPAHRKEFQKKGRETVENLSKAIHPPLIQILRSMPNDLLVPILNFPGVKQMLDISSIPDNDVKKFFEDLLS